MVLFVKDKWIWYCHPTESWIPVQLLEQEGDFVVVKSQIGEHYRLSAKDDFDSVHPGSLRDVENMVDLSELTEGAILHDLRIRYEKDLIYTYISEIIVSINPYKMLSYYGPSSIELYKEKLAAREKVSPHVYALADNAFKNLVMDGKSQAVVISGESGAGKTEATKLVLQYLSDMSGQGSEIEQQILEANPVMEAFGNAKTVRNDNSSRFGKFIEVMFDEHNLIFGSRITSYLLEKSRVTQQTEGERNYHIFYQMCAGATEEEKKKWFLRPAAQYRLLNGGKTISLPGVSDVHNWKATRDAMVVLEFSEDEQEQIFRCMSCILQLGEVEFVQKGDKSDFKDVAALETLAGMLRVELVRLGQALITRIIKVGRDHVTSFLTRDQAQAGKDAFCKALYDRVFLWLISKINATLFREKEKFTFIGVLDIFGFEIFEINSFEQFCINYANEKLQKHFIHQVFSMEQAEYKLEEINISAVSFVDNQLCLDLIETKNTGILSMISEETKLPKGSDTNLLERLHKAHEKHDFYSRPKTKSPSFTIKHYAGEVTYLITGFMDKDMDKLNADLAKVCMGSTDPFLSSLFTVDDLLGSGLDAPEKNDGKDAKKRPGSSPAAKKRTADKSTLQKGSSTLGGQFKASLTSLMATIQVCGPHFIRCIKPNALKIPDQFDGPLVARQLRYLGLREVVNIRQQGYPIRRSHESFVTRYRMLVPGFVVDEKNIVGDDCSRLLQEIKGIEVHPDEIRVGRTKFFTKLRVQTILEKLRDTKIMAVVVRLQSLFRAKRAFVRFALMKTAKEELELRIKEGNITALEQCISQAEELEVSMALIAEARKVLNHLIRVRDAKTALIAATESPSRDMSLIEHAIKGAKEIGLDPNTCVELRAASDLLEALKQYLKDLKKATETKNTELLGKVLQGAQVLGLATEREASAKKMHLRLLAEESMIGKLEAAIKQRELENLAHVLREAEEMGFLDGYPLKKDHVQAAKAVHDQLVVEKEATEALDLAIESRDITILESALKQAEEAKITSSEKYTTASDLKQQLIKEQKLTAATDGLKTALKAKKLNLLEAAVKNAKESGLTEAGVPQLIIEAEEMMGRIVKINEIIAKLQQAIDASSFDALEASIKLADDEKISEWDMGTGLAVTRAKKIYKQISTAKESLEASLKSLDAKAVDLALESALKIGSPDLTQLISQTRDRLTWLHERISRFNVLQSAVSARNEKLLETAVEKAVADGHWSKHDKEIVHAQNLLDDLISERVRHEQELAAALAAADEEQRQKLEEEQRRVEEIERRRREDEERRIREEEERKAAEEDERRRKEAEEKFLKEEAERKIVEAKKREEERKRREEEERKRQEEEERLRLEEERLRLEEERLLKEEEERRRQEEEALIANSFDQDKDKARQDLEIRLKREEEERKQKIEEERKRRQEKVQDEERRRKEEEAQRVVEEEENRRREELERQRRFQQAMLEEEERKRREREDKRKAEEEEKKAELERAMEEGFEDEEEGKHEVLAEGAVRAVPKFEPQLYTSEEYEIHLFPKLRTPEQFAKGLLLSRDKVKKEMLRWSKDVIPRSLTRVEPMGPSDKTAKKALDKKSIAIFKSLQGVMGDRHYSFPDSLACEILENGLKLPQLRDEIYMQIIKQVTENPKTESLIRGWQMMGLCCETFPPTDLLRFYLIHFILNHLSEQEHPAADYIEYCLRTLQQCLPPASVPPTIDHVTAFKERMMKSAFVILTFPDGSEIELNIDPSLTLGQLMPMIKKEIGLKDDKFGIFQVGPRSEFRIQDNECLLDFDAANSPDRSVRFLLKKFMYTKRGRTNDHVALSIIYHQAVIDVMTGMFDLKHEDRIKIAAIHKKLAEAKYFKPIGRENKRAMDAVRGLNYVPTYSWPDDKKNVYFAEVKAAMAALPDDTRPEDLLEIVRQYPVWGCQFYNVQQDDASLPNLVLGINLQGVFLLDANTRRVLKKFSYGHLNGWANNSVKFCLRVLVAKGQTMQFNLITKQGKRIHQSIQENIDYLVRAMNKKKAKSASS